MVNGGAGITIEDIPSSFDRSQEPPKGPDALLMLPDIWQGEFANGLTLYGIEHRQLSRLGLGRAQLLDKEGIPVR